MTNVTVINMKRVIDTVERLSKSNSKLKIAALLAAIYAVSERTVRKRYAATIATLESEIAELKKVKGE